MSLKKSIFKLNVSKSGVGRTESSTIEMSSERALLFDLRALVRLSRVMLIIRKIQKTNI
jgi:hypothetical protein